MTRTDAVGTATLVVSNMIGEVLDDTDALLEHHGPAIEGNVNRDRAIAEAILNLIQSVADQIDEDCDVAQVVRLSRGSL